MMSAPFYLHHFIPQPPQTTVGFRAGNYPDLHEDSARSRFCTFPFLRHLPLFRHLP